MFPSDGTLFLLVFAHLRVCCGRTWVHSCSTPVRFSTTAKKVLPRNTDFICGNQKRTANPHKCTFSCGIGRDFHITLKLVGGPQASYEHICLVLPTSVSGTTQLARLEISGGPPCETHGFRNRKLEVGSWKLYLVNFVYWFRKRLVDLGTEKAPGTKLAKSNFQLPTSNFLFLKTEGHVFSNPLY